MQKMTNAQRQQFQLIAKIAEAHFDAERFSGQDLEQRIDEVLQQLGVEQLAIAQWMWRLNPLNDDLRIARMTEQGWCEIRDAFCGLVSRAKWRNWLFSLFRSFYAKRIRAKFSHLSH